MSATKPTVLFICQHNAGRSQLGAALLDHLASDRYTADSAGLAPADALSVNTVATLAELGIDASGRVPRHVTVEDLRTADVVVTMKPDLRLPAEPAGRLVQWQFPDPAAWDTDGIRPLRDAIGARVDELVRELDSP